MMSDKQTNETEVGILNEQQVMTLYGVLDPKDKAVISDVLRKYAGDEVGNNETGSGDD